MKPSVFRKSWTRICARFLLVVVVIYLLLYLSGKPYREFSENGGIQPLRDSEFMKGLFDTSYSFNVLSFSDHGPDELQLFSKANHQNYCDKYNIRYRREFSETQKLKDMFSKTNSSYDARFLKINSILSTFEEMNEGDWVLWVDEDAFFTNYELSHLLARFHANTSLILAIDPYARTVVTAKPAGKHFVAVMSLRDLVPREKIVDQSLRLGVLFNTGVIALKKCAWSISLLKKVNDVTTGNKQIDNGDQVRRDEISDHFLKILTHVIVFRPMQCAPHFLIVPTRFFNSFCRSKIYFEQNAADNHNNKASVWARGDFIAHLNGMSRAMKLQYAQQIMPSINPLVESFVSPCPLGTVLSKEEQDFL